MNAVLLWICNALCRNLLLEVSFFRLLCVSFVFFRFFFSGKIGFRSLPRKKERNKKEINYDRVLAYSRFQIFQWMQFPNEYAKHSVAICFVLFLFFFVVSFLLFCVVFSKEKCRCGIPESPDLRKKENTYKAPWCNLLLFCFFILYFCLFLCVSYSVSGFQ